MGLEIGLPCCIARTACGFLRAEFPVSAGAADIELGGLLKGAGPGLDIEWIML